MKSMRENNTIKKFSPKKFCSNDVEVAELAQVYHTVKHHQRYLSLDCSFKLQTKIHSDSKTSCQIPRKSKSVKAILSNVVLPFSLDLVEEELTGNRVVYSLTLFFHQR